ncbi:hypothetical protein L218DRAFT_1015879 [Marasmius fiardii PR-910]|nr:hypothetical protein L218DRAFT_1015879 [Marasmius fiardii PR-910]
MVKLNGPTTDTSNALPVEHRHYARAYAELHPALSIMMCQPNCVAWPQVLSVLNSTFDDLHATANADEEDNMYPSALLLSMDSVLDAVETDNFTFSDLPGWRLPAGTIEFLKEQEGVLDLGFKYSPIGWIQRITKVFNCNCKAHDAEDKTTQPKSWVASTSGGKSTAAASDNECQNIEDNDDELVEDGPDEDKEEEINQVEPFVPQKAIHKEKFLSWGLVSGCSVAGYHTLPVRKALMSATGGGSNEPGVFPYGSGSAIPIIGTERIGHSRDLHWIA